MNENPANHYLILRSAEKKVYSRGNISAQAGIGSLQGAIIGMAEVWGWLGRIDQPAGRAVRTLGDSGRHLGLAACLGHRAAGVKGTARRHVLQRGNRAGYGGQAVKSA